MPIYSMTGFARAQVRVNDQLSYTLSIKSVNHRFLDVQLRLPSGLDALEMELRKVIKDNLIRGHVDLTLSIDRGSQQAAGYNRELVNSYLAAFAEAREEHGLTGQQPDLNAVLRLPGALQSDKSSNGDEEQTALTESVLREIGSLLEQLKTMRAREGEALEAILRGTLNRLAEAVEGVAALRPEVEERYQARLTERLLAATGPEFNRQRLLEEVAVLVERSDIAEELERMTTHISHF
ncbi:MAG TPA: YicC/YloC family endoribonuclease, partial [Terracidiphilus sp.]